MLSPEQQTHKLHWNMTFWFPSIWFSAVHQYGAYLFAWYCTDRCRFSSILDKYLSICFAPIKYLYSLCDLTPCPIIDYFIFASWSDTVNWCHRVVVYSQVVDFNCHFVCNELMAILLSSNCSLIWLDLHLLYTFELLFGGWSWIHLVLGIRDSRLSGLCRNGS